MRQAALAAAELAETNKAKALERLNITPTNSSKIEKPGYMKAFYNLATDNPKTSVGLAASALAYGAYRYGALNGIIDFINPYQTTRDLLGANQPKLMKYTLDIKITDDQKISTDRDITYTAKNNEYSSTTASITPALNHATKKGQPAELFLLKLMLNTMPNNSDEMRITISGTCMLSSKQKRNFESKIIQVTKDNNKTWDTIAEEIYTHYIQPMIQRSIYSTVNDIPFHPGNIESVYTCKLSPQRLLTKKLASFSPHLVNTIIGNSFYYLPTAINNIHILTSDDLEAIDNEKSLKALFTEWAKKQLNTKSMVWDIEPKITFFKPNNNDDDTSNINTGWTLNPFNSQFIFYKTQSTYNLKKVSFKFGQGVLEELEKTIKAKEKDLKTIYLETQKIIPAINDLNTNINQIQTTINGMYELPAQLVGYITHQATKDALNTKSQLLSSFFRSKMNNDQYITLFQEILRLVNSFEQSLNMNNPKHDAIFKLINEIKETIPQNKNEFNNKITAPIQAVMNTINTNTNNIITYYQNLTNPLLLLNSNIITTKCNLLNNINRVLNNFTNQNQTIVQCNEIQRNLDQLKMLLNGEQSDFNFTRKIMKICGLTYIDAIHKNYLPQSFDDYLTAIENNPNGSHVDEGIDLLFDLYIRPIFTKH